MSHRLFKVDLSDGARDFKPTATEPGLAMLDRNNANYSILRRWLGEFVAEPEWMGQDAHFFVREDARGRLENIHCIPCTKADLLGPLQPQLEEIDQKLRRAKPETANEQLLHRIVRKKFADLTRDYDASDFHCHFFKYRQGSEPWRLIWVWGYQRTDMEPARSLICGNPECEALYAKRPKQRARCPVCASTAARGQKPPAPLWLRISQLALLLLLLLGGILFFALNRPRLVVTPDDWSGPPGSRVDYKAQHKRWFFFNDDVTDRVVPQSEDKRIMRFGPSGTQAKARSPGNVRLTFHYKNLTSAATAHVGPPKQPASVKLEPAGDIDVRTGATKEVKLIGYYDEKEKLDPVDLSEMAEWTAEDAAIAFFVRPGVCEGGTEGITNITARYRASEKDKWLPATAKAVVKKVDYQSIELAVVPQTIGMGQSGRIDVHGIGPDGAKYSLLGSSLLKLSVDPENIAKIDGDYLVGLAKGSAELKATFLGDKFNATAKFSVGDSLLAAGTFIVTPKEAKIRVSEYLDLDVLSASSEPIKTLTSDNSIVEVVGEHRIVGLAPGKATVTLKQGNASAIVEVSVSEANLITLRIDPPVITLVSGVTSGIRVYAIDKSGQEIDVVPDRVTWVKQPPAEYARLSRDAMALTGLSPTDQAWPLVAQLGTNESIRAEATVRVVASPLVSTSIIDLAPDEWWVHPPVSVYGKTHIINTGTTTSGVVFDANRGLVIGDDVAPDSLFGLSNLQKGYTIISHEGRDLTGMSRAELEEYFRTHPFQFGQRVGIRTVDGAGGLVKLGVTSYGVVQEVRLHRVAPQNITQENFNASLDLDLREAAEYRVTNAEGEGLTDWQELGPTPLTTMTTAKIPRNASDRYELFIERKIGDNVDRYQLKFTLTPDQL